MIYTTQKTKKKRKEKNEQNKKTQKHPNKEKKKKKGGVIGVDIRHYTLYRERERREIERDIHYSSREFFFNIHITNKSKQIKTKKTHTNKHIYFKFLQSLLKTFNKNPQQKHRGKTHTHTRIYIYNKNNTD